MPSNHLILLPLLLLPSVFASIRVFSSELALRIRWPKYWHFSFSISLSNEYSRLIFFRIDWFDLLAVQGAIKSLLQYHSLKVSVFQCSAFFMANSYSRKKKKLGRNRHYHQEVYGYLGKEKMFSFFCLSLSVLVLLFLFPPSWALLLSPRADIKTRFSSPILYPTLTHLFSPICLPQSLTLVCLLARVSSRTLKQRVVDLFL